MSFSSKGTPEATRLRICMVTYELVYGGVERQVELLSQAAKEAGHHVTLIIMASRGPALPRFESICDVIQILDANIQNDSELFTKLSGAAAAQSWDAVIFYTTAKIALLSHALMLSARRQAVYVGNPVPHDWLTYLKHRYRHWKYPPLRDIIFLGCSQHVTQSLGRDRYFKQYRSGVSWNCVQIPQESLQLREQCEPLHFGMVARLDRIKDQATLIEATAHLKKQNKTAVLHLVGQGDEESRLRQMARELNVTGEVIFEGSTDDVYAKMAGWDIFTFSTTRDEGFGAAAAEAMAFGMPCLFTDVGPCREVGSDTVGYIPERSPQVWAEQLTRLAVDHSERRRLGQAARQRALSYFTKERMWGEYLDALGLSSPSPPPS